MIEKIKSNTKSKLNKIKEGVVFDNPLTFVSEIIQNSYRAKCKNLDVTFSDQEGIIRFTDDGCGLKNYNSILTLDTSDWESTNEGFGIGLWSYLAVPEIEYCKIKSKIWEILIDTKDISKSDTEPNATIELIPKIKGFSIELKSNYLINKIDKIFPEVEQYAKYAPFNTKFNDILIEKEDIFDLVSESYTKEYNTKLFKAKLSIEDGKGYPSVQIYYEGRYVKKEFYSNHLSGIIEIKKGAISLKEPDRKSFVYDEKYNKFTEVLSVCEKDIFTNFVKYATIEELNKYSSSISYILPVKHYIKYLSIDGCDYEDQVENKRDAENNCDINKNLDEQDYSASISQSSKIKEQDFVQKSNCSAYNIATVQNQKATTDTNIIKIKKITKKVWIRATEVSENKDLIANAEYYGIKVFISKNQMYDNAFKYMNIPYITEINNNIQKIYSKNNVCLKNIKEQNFIKLLQPICNYYNLPYNTFLIGDLKMTVIVKIDGVKLIKSVIKNKDKLTVYGVRDDDKIILDRKGLNLKKYKIGDRIGKWEIKAILGTVELISHELAHLLYDTKDNTIEHYKAQCKIQNEISAIYCRL